MPSVSVRPASGSEESGQGFGKRKYPFGL